MTAKSLFFTLLFCVIFNLAGFGQTLDQCKKILDSGYVAMDKGNYSVALEYFTKTELIAEKNGYYRELFETKNSMGIVYVDISDYVEALNHYLDAYTVAIKHLDASREMVVLNNIAVLYAMEKNFAKAKEYYLKAYNIAKQEGNSIKVALYAINLAKTENSVEKYKEGKKYIEEALTIFKEDKNNQKYVIAAEVTFAECLIFEGKLEEAKQKLAELYSKTENDNDKENKASVLFKLAHVYWLEKKYEKSIFYIKLALKDTNELERRLDLYDSLSEVYEEVDDFENALKSKKEVLKIRDSLSKINNNKLYETNKAKFEIQNYKNDLNAQFEKSSQERKIFISAILIFIVLLFLVYRMFRNRAIKQEQKKIIAEREQKIIALELEKEKNENLLLEKQVKEIENEALLEQETLKNEIEQKNRKLSARALYLSGRNEMIEEIVDSLSELPEVSQNMKLKTHIKTLKEHLKTDAEWDTFIVHFEEVNQGLLSALKEKHPNLSSNDTRFICYVYMNLSLKEIGTIFNITQEACRKRKERIFRKMEIDKDVSFYEYLSRLA